MKLKKIAVASAIAASLTTTALSFEQSEKVDIYSPSFSPENVIGAVSLVSVRAATVLVDFTPRFVNECNRMPEQKDYLKILRSSPLFTGAMTLAALGAAVDTDTYDKMMIELSKEVHSGFDCQ